MKKSYMENKKTTKFSKQFTTINSNEILSSEKDKDIFFDLISKETTPNNALKSAMKTYNKFTHKKP